MPAAKLPVAASCEQPGTHTSRLPPLHAGEQPPCHHTLSLSRWYNTLELQCDQPYRYLIPILQPRPTLEGTHVLQLPSAAVGLLPCQPLPRMTCACHETRSPGTQTPSQHRLKHKKTKTCRHTHIKRFDWSRDEKCAVSMSPNPHRVCIDESALLCGHTAQASPRVCCEKAVAALPVQTLATP